MELVEIDFLRDDSLARWEFPNCRILRFSVIIAMLFGGLVAKPRS